MFFRSRWVALSVYAHLLRRFAQHHSSKFDFDGTADEVRFILIDPITNETVAAGMIAGVAAGSGADQRVGEIERQVRNGHRAAIIVVENNEIAMLLERKLFDLGLHAIWVPRPIDPAPQTEVLALYNSGALVILSETPELVSIKSAYVIHLSIDDAKNPEFLVEQIRLYTSLG